MNMMPNFVAFHVNINQEDIDSLTTISKHNDFTIGSNRTINSVNENPTVMLCYGLGENMPYGVLVNNNAVFENTAIMEILTRIINTDCANIIN